MNDYTGIVSKCNSYTNILAMNGFTNAKKSRARGIRYHVNET